MSQTKTPQTPAEWWDQRRKDISERFPKHLATYENLGERTERLIWKQPGTGIDRVDYFADGHHLFVTGDLGDAIYRREFGLRWWSGCGLHYFASKCEASETGRGYWEWDAHYAAARLFERWGGCSWILGKLYELHALEALGSAHEWDSWIGDNADEVWGSNWTDEEPWGLGKVVSFRCELQLTGLKLAMAQGWA